MLTIVDTSAIIEKKLNMNDKMILPESVLKEIKDTRLLDYLNNYNYEIVNPKTETVQYVNNISDKHNLLLSEVDCEVVALTYEQFNEKFDKWLSKNDNIRCLTLDKGILQALSILNLYKYPKREFIFRCFACFTVYKKSLDFCKKCGYATITRVSINSADGNKFMFKKNFVYKEKIIKDKYGNVIKCAGQREYKQLK